MRRFFIGDMYGRLALLVLGERPELILIPLGEVRLLAILSIVLDLRGFARRLLQQPCLI